MCAYTHTHNSLFPTLFLMCATGFLLGSHSTDNGCGIVRWCSVRAYSHLSVWFDTQHCGWLSLAIKGLSHQYFIEILTNVSVLKFALLFRCIALTQQQWCNYKIFFSVSETVEPPYKEKKKELIKWEKSLYMNIYFHPIKPLVPYLRDTHISERKNCLKCSLSVFISKINIVVTHNIVVSCQKCIKIIIIKSIMYWYKKYHK